MWYSVNQGRGGYVLIFKFTRCHTFQLMVTARFYSCIHSSVRLHGIVSGHTECDSLVSHHFDWPPPQAKDYF